MIIDSVQTNNIKIDVCVCVCVEMKQEVLDKQQQLEDCCKSLK